MPKKKASPATKKEEGMVKTTVLLPESLWAKAKLRAVSDRTNFRHVVIEALEKHLSPVKSTGRRRKP